MQFKNNKELKYKQNIEEVTKSIKRMASNPGAISWL